MFSTSMIASSTTTPIATTSPASTITLMVASRRSSTRIAASSDSGIAIRLMNAVRHSNRKAMMIRITSRMPISSARVRLSIDCSMNVAGRKMVVSTSTLGSPGCISFIASSMPFVTSMRVRAAELLDDQHQAGSVVDDALAPDRLVVLA